MSFSKEDIYMIQGRMGYEFSTCFRGSELVFRKLARYFEPTKSCATRYGFEIMIDMDIVNEKFTIKQVYYKFLEHYNNSLLNDVQEPESSGGLTKQEIAQIVSKSNEIIPNCDEFTEITMISVVDLFKIFLIKDSYKSVIVPCIVNYGKNSSMSHQCAFIALGKPHNAFMFYEPYGIYEKYKKNYKPCFDQIFSVFRSVDVFSNWSYQTYHDYFKFPLGIQGMMLKQGSFNKDKFLQSYKKIKTKMGASGEKWKYEGDEYDDTFPVSTLMSKVARKPEFIKEAAILYRKYSAKICVSIFLVESARLMFYLSQESSYESVKTNLSKWYERYSSDATSQILIELYQIIDLIYPDDVRDYVYAVFGDVNNSPSTICEKLSLEVTRPHWN